MSNWKKRIPYTEESTKVKAVEKVKENLWKTISRVRN